MDYKYQTRNIEELIEEFSLYGIPNNWSADQVEIFANDVEELLDTLDKLINRISKLRNF